MTSPYFNEPTQHWKAITSQLISNFPISMEELRSIVDQSWTSLFDTLISGKFRIGTDIFPKPQIMGFFIHEIVALECNHRYPNLFRPEEDSRDKDVVCLKDELFSFEIKTSSNKDKIFGNRSYAQKSGNGKKAKDGYYLTVNFPKVTTPQSNRQLYVVRFGWLDHSDWIGQAAATGQQSRLPAEVYSGKLIAI